MSDRIAELERELAAIKDAASELLSVVEIDHEYTPGTDLYVCGEVLRASMDPSIKDWLPHCREEPGPKGEP